MSFFRPLRLDLGQNPARATATIAQWPRRACPHISMRSKLLALAFSALSTIAVAQSPLTTTFANNNGGAVGGGIYFDVNVTAPSGIVVNGLEVNLGSAASTAGTIEVYTCPSSRTGNQGNSAVWTLVSSGAVTAAGAGTPSAVAIAPFTLPAGQVGMAFKAVGVAHAYTNGNGSNQTYSNGDLSLSCGEASNVAFTAPILTPRVVNCRISYDRAITTTFTSNNGLSGTSAVYFDVDVTNASGITLTGLDLALSTAAGNLGHVDVYTCPTGRAGNITTPSAWSLVGSGSVTSTGIGSPSRVVLDHSIPLSFGTVGMAITSSLGVRYTNGNGSNQNYSNTDLSIACGESSSPPFATPFSPRVANLQLLYQTGISAPQATRSNYGTGCTSTVASFYELFSTPSTFDLGNRSMTMTPAAPGYTVSSGGLFHVPGGGAVTLALGDDATVATPVLSTPFPYQGGTASQLHVCSNGFVSVAAGNTNGFTPSTLTLLNGSQTAWYCWHDYNPVTFGSGQVLFEDVAGIAYITWNGVWNFGGSSIADANTFQFQFNLASGEVKLVWGQMANSGNAYLVGYSPGGASVDPGNRDLTNALLSGFAISGADDVLTINALQRPIPGNLVGIVTGNVNPNTLFGAVILGLTQYPAGISLAPQMAGCFQYTDGSITLPLFLGNAPTQTVQLLIPNAVGLHAYAQSAIFCPGANLTLLGGISSGGIDLGIGLY